MRQKTVGIIDVRAYDSVQVLTEAIAATARNDYTRVTRLPQTRTVDTMSRGR